MPVTKYFSALVSTVVATAVLSCLPGLRGQESQAHSVAPAAGPAGAAVAASRTNTFAIARYQLAGNTVLPLELVDQCLAPAVGTSVALDEIRHALGELQLEYRNLGYRDARVVMPAQALTNGVVLLQVSEGKPIGPPPAASSTNSSAASAGGAASAGALPGTQYQVRGYTITGNSLLPASVVERSFVGATGSAVSLQQIRRALGRLELAYRDRGYAGVRVAMPRQELADGVVRIEVVEKIPGAEEKPADRAIAGAPAAGRAEAPTNAPPVRTFEVRHYEVVGNTVLPQRVIEQSFTNAIGPKVSMEMIRQGLSRLQLAYRERGFATVAVGLPQQQLTNATITVKVTEGKLAQIRVTGNNFFSSNNVLRALPSLHTNILPNSHVLQRELDVANVNRDRQIYPTVGPGPDPGTSELTLKVKDRLPLHGRAEVDNYSTPGTPDLRVNVAAQYNNLWQREQQIGVS